MVLDTSEHNSNVIKRVKVEANRISNYGDISTVSGSKILTPFEQVMACSEPTAADLIEAIIYWTQENFGIEEFAEAKTQFQTVSGRVFPDEYFYHQRICYFLDYFTFERPLQAPILAADKTSSKEGVAAKSPFHLFMDSNYLLKIDAPATVCSQFHELAKFRHSLFKIIKMNKQRMVLKDLMQQDTIELAKSSDYLFQGFETGLILQGFIFFQNSGPCLSQGILTHPANIARIISKALQPYKKNPELAAWELLAKLAKQNLNLIRHRFLDAKKIYTQSPR